MSYNKVCPIWSLGKTIFFPNKDIKALKQSGPHCVSTTLAQITGESPEYFQKSINTQDPVSWSDALKPFQMKLAYCPVDVRKVKYYVDKIILHWDLFLLSYYSPIDSSILKDPDSEGWVCGSHIVTVYQDQIFDTKLGVSQKLNEHSCLDHYTKRLFRVVPSHYERGL